MLQKQGFFSTLFLYRTQVNYSIQQIANKVGYSSETAFSQAFKRTFERSPTQYRQQFIEAES
jgi:AraC-like DNA-binding protein